VSDEREVPIEDIPAKPLPPRVAAKLAEAMRPEVIAKRGQRLAKARRQGTEGAWRELGSHKW
jgi:hypothetical protein